MSFIRVGTPKAASLVAPVEPAAAQPATAAKIAPGLQAGGIPVTRHASTGMRALRPGAPRAPGVNVDGKALSLNEGATSIADRATFEKLARSTKVPGAADIPEVKFLIMGIDTGKPELYFINSQNHPYHFDFYQKVLGGKEELGQFNDETYQRLPSLVRKNVAGGLVLHDSFKSGGKQGLYALEFWPTDPVPAQVVSQVFELIAKHAPFLKEQLAYHPAGTMQEQLYKEEKAALDEAGVKTITTDTLYENVTFSALNGGVGYGYLKVFTGAANETPASARDIPIFTSLPNDLGHVGGVISSMPQTPMSHVNLKAQQNHTPNAYVKDAANDPRIKPFIGKLVKLEVNGSGFKIDDKVSEAEANAFLDKIRPKRGFKLPRDLKAALPKKLGDLSAKDRSAFGAKTANDAELRKILPGDMVPDGFGIPFSFYDRFMKATGLYDEAKEMLADPVFDMSKKDFTSGTDKRRKLLKDFQKKIKKADVPSELAEELAIVQKGFPKNTPLRCRSSSNVEDGDNFSGAGLHDSYTHDADEGDIGKTVKKVWASLWNLRAYDEREFYRLDHLQAAMGVLVHPAYKDEKANGVAVTRNLIQDDFPGYYVNVQVGDSLVTNPDAHATPDEFSVAAIGLNGENETQYARHSSLSKGKDVLSLAQVKQLVDVMKKIQEHFVVVYDKQHDPSFAMDIEFKITKAGKLAVKQARPYVA